VRVLSPCNRFEEPGPHGRAISPFHKHKRAVSGPRPLRMLSVGFSGQFDLSAMRYLAYCMRKEPCTHVPKIVQEQQLAGRAVVIEAPASSASIYVAFGARFLCIIPVAAPVRPGSGGPWSLAAARVCTKIGPRCFVKCCVKSRSRGLGVKHYRYCSEVSQLVAIFLQACMQRESCSEANRHSSFRSQFCFNVWAAYEGRRLFRSALAVGGAARPWTTTLRQPRR
jgi:hypothetical protein